ncbi:CocE/NonD family hydrolase [Streptomyces sp. NPDC088387]|uniref:CocE/NonD family hydrolase n=1 Tax=Streptomyces sp. NPDC088387 TaxID=3365859 RepID=UPI00381B3512
MSAPRPAGRLARTLGVLQGRVLGLPPARTRYSVHKDLRVPTRDDAVLLTDHYIPERDPRGTVLIRSVYGRGLPHSLYGRAFAARGYHVVLQSVRGTAGSTGTFRPIVQEADDAQDTVAWLRTRDWFDGRLATFGGSYLGWAQWALLQDPPPELRAAAVVVGPHDFQQAINGTGALALADFLTWSANVEAQGLGGVRGLRAMLAARGRLAAAWSEPTAAAAATVALGGSAPWFREWLDHPHGDDPYWADYRAEQALERVDVPVLLFGGWHDVFLDQTLHQYEVLRRHNPSVALTVGPWTHMDTAAKATRVIDAQVLRWLDLHMGTEDTSAGGTAAGPGGTAGVTAPVEIFHTGANTWLSLPSWPPAATGHTLWLRADGGLGQDPDEGEVGFRHDPADPTPSLGGRHMSPKAGPADVRSLEQRADTLAFTGAALTEPVDVIGTPHVEFELTVDTPHADVFVRLCDVDGRGRSHVVTERFERLSPAPVEATTIRLELGACAHRFAAGHRIRLDFSGGAHPRYDRGTGTDTPGVPAPVGHRIGVATSRLTLPVVEDSALDSPEGATEGVTLAVRGDR